MNAKEHMMNRQLIRCSDGFLTSSVMPCSMPPQVQKSFDMSLAFTVPPENLAKIIFPARKVEFESNK